MIRRMNYTGRKRISRSRVTVRLLPAAGGGWAFDADFDLFDYEFPRESSVFVEAYNATSYMRFAFGTVGAICSPADTRLVEITACPLPRFRVKIVDMRTRFGLLLGVADKLIPLRPDEDLAPASRCCQSNSASSATSGGSISLTCRCSSSTGDLPAQARVDAKPFASRWGIAQHLSERLAPVPPEEVEDNAGLWSWLTLFYFDQLCPRQPDGARKPGRDYRHIPDFSSLYRHRHLLYGSFAVYRRHRGYAILVLSGPPHFESALYQEITSRQDLLASRGVIEAPHAFASLRSSCPRGGYPKSPADARLDSAHLSA